MLCHVSPSAWKNSAPTRRIFMIFGIREFLENPSRKSSFIKIGQKWHILYKKTNINFWPYPAQCFLKWEKFQTKLLEENKTHYFVQWFFFPKIVPFMRYRGKILSSGAGHKWQYGACTFRAEYLRLQTHYQNSNIYCFSTAIIVARTSPNITLYVHRLSCLRYCVWMLMPRAADLFLLLSSFHLYSRVLFFTLLDKPSGPRPILSCSTITRKYTTLGRTHLHEWFSRRSDLYLKTRVPSRSYIYYKFYNIPRFEASIVCGCGPKPSVLLRSECWYFFLPTIRGNLSFLS
jgi:hypothetical protein